ncbi:MAG: class I SAM-dependent methyltransferase [Planctomycetota bacterium]|nr:class I SAM-dependent methyltransferase [Planctomycetota bacterium]
MQDKEARRWTFDAIPREYLVARPRYPDAMVDALIQQAAMGPDDRALEVGPGPGVATRQFAERGIGILAVELGPKLAEVAREYLRDFPKVVIENRDVNAWTPPTEAFRLVYAGQAWHWVDPETGFRKAYDALVPGGVFAPFWNHPADGHAELLQPAYLEHAPELHKERPYASLDERVETRVQDFLAAGVFDAVDPQRFPWTMRRTADEYIAMIATYSDHLRMDPERCARLFDAIRERIEANGGFIERPVTAVAYVCRKPD